MAQELTEDSKSALKQEIAAILEVPTEELHDLTKDQLEVCLNVCGCVPTEQDLDVLLEHFDINDDGRLSVDEVLNNIHIFDQHILRGDDLMEAFQLLDKSGDGYIRLADMKKVLCHNDFIQWDEAEKIISYCIKNFDKNRDGKFNYPEFIEAFTSDTFRAKFCSAAESMSKEKGPRKTEEVSDETILQQVRDGAEDLDK